MNDMDYDVLFAIGQGGDGWRKLREPKNLDIILRNFEHEGLIHYSAGEPHLTPVGEGIIRKEMGEAVEIWNEAEKDLDLDKMADEALDWDNMTVIDRHKGGCPDCGNDIRLLFETTGRHRCLYACVHCDWKVVGNSITEIMGASE